MRMEIFRLTVTFVCLCVCGLSQAKESQKLPIEGQVVDYRAKPVDGAEIAVYEQLYENGEFSAHLIAPIVRTDQQGRFTLQADIPTQYTTIIVARKKGLASAWDVLYNSRNAEKGHFLLVLEKAYGVTGSVADSQGKAVSGAKVQASPKTSYLSRLRQLLILAPKEWFTTTTDSQGRFQFNQFTPDVSCDFWVEAPGFGSTYKFTTQSRGFEVWRSDIRLVLPREGNIEGRVIEAGTGRPVGGVEMAVKTNIGWGEILNLYYPRTIKADANGVFECTGLVEGKHRIVLSTSEDQTPLWAAKPVDVNVVPNRTLNDVQVLLEKGELVGCTVREYGSERPLAGMRVSVYNETCSARAITDEKGAAKLRVPLGEYHARAEGKRYISWRVNKPIIVSAGETVKVNILLDKSPTLTGSVVDANGRPARNVLVVAHPFGDQVYTDGEGKFVAGYDEKRTGQGLFVMARDFEHSLAALVRTKEFERPVKLILGPALTVKGKITNPNGIGIPAARVSLCFRFARCLSQMGAEVLTDSQGVFTFNAIPPVNSDFDYRVSVDAAGFGPKIYNRISIDGKPGNTTDIQTIELVPANVSISGLVVDANGSPAAQVPVFSGGANDFDQPRKTTTTNEDGLFVMKRICEGPLRLQANLTGLPGGVEAGFLLARGGDKDVKIILGQERVHHAYVSLAGKPLPELKDIGIRLSPADIEGKRILICFWDMHQRPSRNCIGELAKRAEELKENGVTVVTVQASKVEENALNQWVKDYNIPFPVGMVQGDEEKTRFTWGVKSLPWLILTDKQHVVTAEGFALTELDEKLNGNSKN